MLALIEVVRAGFHLEQYLDFLRCGIQIFALNMFDCDGYDSVLWILRLVRIRLVDLPPLKPASWTGLAQIPI